jgi:GNAT superfamily N-acetyltransferase
MIIIKKIKTSELECFLNSEAYQNNIVIPISSNRAQSYIENPRSDSDDIVMILAYENEVLIGYRTLLSDFFVAQNKEVRFAWLSGVWVSELKRRQGIGTLLLEEAYQSWDGNLMYSNYAPSSKKLLDKTAKFDVLAVKNGYRYYLRSCFVDLLEHRLGAFNVFLPLLRRTDAILNKLIDCTSLNKQHINTDSVSKEDQEKLFSNYLKGLNSLFGRTAEEFDWIRTFPWLSSSERNKQFSLKYYFSFYKKRVEQIFGVLKEKENKSTGIYCLSLVDQHLKVNYTHAGANGWVEISKRIIAYSIKKKVSYVDCYDEDLNAVFSNSKKPFFFKKQLTQNYYCTSKISKNYPEIKNKKIFFGDGDSIFT